MLSKGKLSALFPQTVTARGMLNGMTGKNKIEKTDFGL